MVGLLRFLIVAALLGLVAKLLSRAKRSAEPVASPDWPTWPERHGAPQPGTPDSPDSPAWVEAVEGECPSGYEVKVKESSGIYHVAGMRNYDRTHPDRCYRTTEAAEADGFRASKI